MNTSRRITRRIVALGATAGLLTAGLLIASPASADAVAGTASESERTLTHTLGQWIEPDLRILYPEGATYIAPTTRFEGTALPGAEVWIVVLHQEGAIAATAGPDGRWYATITAPAGPIGVNVFWEGEWISWSGLVVDGM